MAIATTTALALAAMAAAAGGEYYNTQNTARRQDQAAADSIRNQSLLQKKADVQVNDTVQKLAGSNASTAQKARLDDYLSTLQRNKATTTAGLTPTIGSNTFKADAANAANDANGYATKTAGLMASMDAPGIQRQAEGFDYGKLGTDLGLIGRQSQGQSFLDQVRMNGIRRNPNIDLGAGLLNAYAGSTVGAGGAGGTQSYGTGAGNTARVGVNSNGRAVAANPWG